MIWTVIACCAFAAYVTRLTFLFLGGRDPAPVNIDIDMPVEVVLFKDKLK